MKTKIKIQKKKNKSNEKVTKLVTIILLCDSPGYRMKSYGPLSLINIGNKKLIDIQIASIKEAFQKFELVLCLGFDSERVYNYVKNKYPKLNVRVVENQLYNSSNSCEGLRLSLNNICNDNVLICDGNLLIHNKSLLLLDLKRCCTLIESNPCETMEIGLNSDNHNIVQHLSFGAKYIWSEILFLTGRDVIESLRKILVAYDSKTRFIFEALNELISNEYHIFSIANKHQIKKINNIKTYHDIKDKIV
jgi:hypothetical protein